MVQAIFERTQLSGYNFYLEPEKGRGSWGKGQPRNFSVSVDGDETSHIQFIVDKLANKSWPKLLLLKKELKKRGDQIDHLHPLTFLIGVLQSGQGGNFHKLKNKNGRAWKELLQGCLESFHDEVNHHNVTPENLKLFAETIQRDEGQVQHFALCHDWNGLIHWI